MNKLSKFSGLLCLLLISFSMLMAQNTEKQRMSREQLAIKQAKYIAKELSLTTSCLYGLTAIIRRKSGL